MEVTLLLFLGWLKAFEAVDLEYSEEKQTYVIPHTGKTIGEIVQEFLRTIGTEGA